MHYINRYMGYIDICDNSTTFTSAVIFLPTILPYLLLKTWLSLIVSDIPTQLRVYTLLFDPKVSLRVQWPWFISQLYGIFMHLHLYTSLQLQIFGELQQYHCYKYNYMNLLLNGLWQRPSTYYLAVYCHLSKKQKKTKRSVRCCVINTQIHVL